MIEGNCASHRIEPSDVEASGFGSKSDGIWNRNDVSVLGFIEGETEEAFIERPMTLLV